REAADVRAVDPSPPAGEAVPVLAPCLQRPGLEVGDRRIVAAAVPAVEELTGAGGLLRDGGEVAPRARPDRCRRRGGDDGDEGAGRQWRRRRDRRRLRCRDGGWRRGGRRRQRRGGWDRQWRHAAATLRRRATCAEKRSEDETCGD